MGAAAIAAGVGAVGAIGGSLISSSAAKGAANTQANAARQAADTQAAAADRATQAAQEQQAQVRSDLAPFRTAGGTGLDALMASLGLGGTGTNLLAANGINSLVYPQAPFSYPAFNPTQAQLTSTPGYQFTLGQGLLGVGNAAAAQGRGISGAALKGAANYATGLADNTLRTQADIYKMNQGVAQGIYGLNQGIFQNNLSNVLGPLSNLSNLGQTSAVQTGQNSLQSTGQQIGAIQAGGAAQAQGLLGAGASQAAGQVGSANALAGALGTAGNTPLNTLLFKKLLGGGGGSGGFGFTSNAADPTADPRGLFQPNSPGF